MATGRGWLWVRDRLVGDYREFTGSFVDIHDPAIREHAEERMAKGCQWPAQPETQLPASTFTTLWEHRRLDLTVEAHVLREEFELLFSDADRGQARTCLTDATVIKS